MPRKYTEEERASAFWSKVDRSGGPDACWPWLGHINEHGYGTVRWCGRKEKAHRIAWLLAHGSFPPPETPLVLHAPVICHNRACCNLRHLRSGTLADNRHDWALDGTDPQRAKSRCPQGHPYDAANTYVSKDGKRACRACHARRAAERRGGGRSGGGGTGGSRPRLPKEGCSGGTLRPHGTTT